MKSIKNNVKALILIMGLALCIGLAFSLLSYYNSPARAEERYKNAVELKERTEEEAKARIEDAERVRCLAEVDLATKKVKAFYDDKRELEEGEDLQKLVSKTVLNCADSGETMQDHPQGVEAQEVDPMTDMWMSWGQSNEYNAMNSISGNKPPSQLFYVFDKLDGAKVSQKPADHFKANKLLATDISTNGKKLPMYAPSYLWTDEKGIVHDDVISYTVRLTDNPKSTGKQIELYWVDDKGVEKSFWIGHAFDRDVVDGQKLETGDILGISGGCPEDDVLEEVTSGCHVHLEYRVNGEPAMYPVVKKTIHKQEPASSDLGK